MLLDRMAGALVDRPSHIQYGSLLLGPGTPYRWRTLAGWEDLPPLDSGSVPRADAHGTFPGPLLAQARTITLDLMVRAPRTAIGEAVGALGAATAPSPVEVPLVVWLDDRGPLVAQARVTRRAIPTGPGYALGLVTGVALELVASDPRRYGLGVREQTTTLPQREPGLGWPLVWPLDFGPPGATGTVTAINRGSADAHPTVIFRGPVTVPSLTNLDTGDVLEYDIPLAAGESLSVDTAAGTVTLGGASRLYTATARSSPERAFVIPPGETSLAFRAAPASPPTAAVTVVSRDAYW